jgi:formamidopyrimidine-DNA glycosylase
VPEIIEVELYRIAASATIGRTIVAVDAPDGWYVKRGLGPSALAGALRGRVVNDARRHGKLLLLDLDLDLDLDIEAATLGLRFGMTGRLIVDGLAPITELAYGSSRPERAWERFALRFAGGGSLVISDPRRLGGVELDPDESDLGPDACSLTGPQLSQALAGSNAPLKARLMDQTRIAGLGNLLTDEILWRSGLDPARPAGSLDGRQRAQLARTIAATLTDLTARGGSHTGDLQDSRRHGGRCPRDGTPLLRRTVAGRTTYSCPRHQR